MVVVLIATGAAVCLRLYANAAAAGGDVLERVLFSIRQQAGVMAALCATVFAVLTALSTGKAPAMIGAAAGPANPASWATSPKAVAAGT